MNAKICKEAVSKFKVKWVLNEWERTVHSCIDSKIQSLRMKHVNKRKKHILKGKHHLGYLNNLHKDYVLVPADKVANNIIVQRQKLWLDSGPFSALV